MLEAMALASMRQGDKAEARNALEAAIEVEPGNSFPLRSLVSLWGLSGSSEALLQLFKGIEHQRILAVMNEVAAVGQGDQQINEPGTSRTLKALPGSWGVLALACLIKVGMNVLPPGQETKRFWDLERHRGRSRSQLIFVADAAITALVWLPTHQRLGAGDASGRLHWLALPPAPR